MDLLRLALERGATAAQAVEVITEMLLDTTARAAVAATRTGTSPTTTASWSPIPAGPSLLETAGRIWQAERITGAWSISNGLTLPGIAGQGDRLKTRVSACRTRRARTLAAAERASEASDLMRALRDHGDGDEPHYRWLNGAMAAPCMHAGGAACGLADDRIVGERLAARPVRHWVTGTAAPCVGLFKPVRVEDPLDLGPPPTDRADSRSLWWRHERLHRQVMRDPARLRPLFAAERDAVEARWRARPPEPSAAFAEGDRLLADWTARVEAAAGPDTRPRAVRRYWRVRDQRVGVPRSVISGSGG